MILIAIIAFTYSITIPYEDRGILAFIVWLFFFIAIFGITNHLLYSVANMNEKKITIKNPEQKTIYQKLEDQKITTICPNCKLELNQIVNFCPQCGNVFIKKEQNYIRLLIPISKKEYEYKTKNLKFLISIPLICPICGNFKNKNQISIKPLFYHEEQYRSYQKDHAKINIYLCEKHAQERRKIRKITNTSIPIFISFYISLPFIIVWVLVSGSFYAVIVVILIFIVIGYIFVYIVNKNLKISSLIKNHIFHEYFPEIGVIVVVQNNDWAKEFIKLNKCLIIHGSIEDFLIKNENLKKQYELYGRISGILLIVTGLLTVFLSIFLHEIFLILGILGVICLASISIYSYIFIGNLEKKRKEEYWIYY